MDGTSLRSGKPKFVEKRGNATIPNHPPAPALRAAAKFLYKIRTHIIILALAAVYLAVAPGIYSKFFIRLGKPTDLKIDPPVVSPLITFSINSNEEAIVSDQKVLQIVGWAFLANAPDQTSFKKYLVLNSRDRVYYFPYEEVVRWDINDYFKDLGLDLLHSGFWAYVAPETVQSGTYNIGFLFLNKSRDEAYYSCSDRYLLRTPNSITIETGEMPDGSSMIITSSTNSSFTYGVGEQLGLFHFGTDRSIQLWLEEGISELAIAGRNYGRIVGWAFLNGDVDQSKYSRWVILKSDQNTFYYPVNSVERPDVPIVFPELTSRFSGFFADIYEEELPPGTYEISFLFQSRNPGSDYITPTRWTITRTASEFKLGMK